jgi:Tol biopolymer transport system component
MLKNRNLTFFKILAPALCLGLTVTACSGQPTPVYVATDTPGTLPSETVTDPTATPTAMAVKPEATLEASTTSTETAAIPAAASQSTPTIAPPAADRQQPDDWQNWPVVPVISARARQIYEAGLAAGTNPNRLSKVGDCQSIKNVLLGMYDKPGGYTLRENADALNETIMQFAGSFDRDGEAVQGGYNAASELTPLMADPAACEPGETPLECEVREHNPSIMLISLEVWWNGRSPDVYVKNMRQIIDFAISRGILPILSTKADNVEGDQSINLATAKLAYEYDIPLWNWWRAAQALPNHGLDPNRPDGFHISQEFAWPERSFTALQSIDAVWRAVRPRQAMPTATPEPTQAVVDLVQPTATGAPQATLLPDSVTSPALQPVDAALLSNPAGYILMSAATRSGETVNPLGIFLVDPATGTRTQIAPAGMALQAVSPDGKQVLFNHGTSLYLQAVNGAAPMLLTDRFYDRGTSTAVFLPDGLSAAFIASQNNGSMLVLYPLDGKTGWKRLSPAGSNPVTIYPSADNSRLFWQNNQPAGVNISGLDGSSAEYLPGAVKAAISPDGRWLAYEEKGKDDKSVLTLASVDLKTKRPQENIGSQLLDFSWSVDGSRLSLLTLDRSDYSGQWLDVRNLVISTENMGTKILPATTGVNPRAVWSPDSGSLLLTGTQQGSDGYAVTLAVMDVNTGALRDLSASAGYKDAGFIYTSQITWVKPVNP